MIFKLSAPEGFSVNDSINCDHWSFNYVTVRQVVQLTPAGWCMTKLDLKSVYWKVPVDSHFLAISWRGVKYFDIAFPFGLRSDPIIFSAVADEPAWALIGSNILDLAHYLDDFIVWAANAVLPEDPVIVNRLGRQTGPSHRAF